MTTAIWVRKDQRGFTLIELLVVLLMSAVTLAAVMSFFRLQTATMRVENARRAAQVTARGALNFMVRHLEHIGRDPRGVLFRSPIDGNLPPAIQAAEMESLTYQTNLSEDWDNTDTADAWENVTFAYDSGLRAIMVTTADPGGTLPLTDDGDGDTAAQKTYIPAGGLTLTYFDADGNEVAPGGGAGARASIRRINVSITVRGIVPAGYTEPVSLSQDVFLRNVSS